jgi:hypothetical protein
MNLPLPEVGLRLLRRELRQAVEVGKKEILRHAKKPIAKRPTALQEFLPGASATVQQ